MITDCEPSTRGDRSFRSCKAGSRSGSVFAQEYQETEFDMAKNPWMSLWLSAANTWAGAARGHWTAEVRRQQKKVLNEMTKPAARPVSKSRSSTKSSTSAQRKSKG